MGDNIWAIFKPRIYGCYSQKIEVEGKDFNEELKNGRG